MENYMYLKVDKAFIPCLRIGSVVEIRTLLEDENPSGYVFTNFKLVNNLTDYVWHAGKINTNFVVFKVRTIGQFIGRTRTRRYYYPKYEIVEHIDLNSVAGFKLSETNLLLQAKFGSGNSQKDIIFSYNESEKHLTTIFNGNLHIQNEYDVENRLIKTVSDFNGGVYVDDYSYPDNKTKILISIGTGHKKFKIKQIHEFWGNTENIYVRDIIDSETTKLRYYMIRTKNDAGEYTLIQRKGIYDLNKTDLFNRVDTESGFVIQDYKTEITITNPNINDAR